jgi:hypothetical protein
VLLARKSQRADPFTARMRKLAGIINQILRRIYKMPSIVERLTEGVVNRDMRAESHALLNKWKKTGLLEGLD